MSSSISVAKLRKAAVSTMQDTLKNLYNIRTKIDCADKPFKSDKELPVVVISNVNDICSKICDRLSFIFDNSSDPYYERFCTLGKTLVESTCGKTILETVQEIYKMAWQVVKEWSAEDALYVGVIPRYAEDEYFSCEYDDQSHRTYIHWDKEVLGADFLGGISRMLKLLREKRRQPTPHEFIAQHLAYMDIMQGKWGHHEATRGLGTPGFRPHTQTYMSLTDPGEGHIMGTTRFNEWMEGAIIHVEHLERPNHLSRQHIESYRAPSILDFSRVRLHVGPTAPNTYFLGRAVKDSGNFEEDFLKIVNITAAAASAAFFMGAAECKIAMEGLSTNQAMLYMQALRAQVQRSRKQILSAAWNLNQVLIDDFEDGEEHTLTERMDIAMKAVLVTSKGGFDKVTWDGASDTYPSKCIMYQLNFSEALTIVHEAHLKGLVTYFSAGFKFDEIQHAVYAGVDGIGIGGAQVLRFMDSETGMHGPYTEENIPRILNRRDLAAKTIRGRGVNILVRLDTMFFEGSITRPQEYFRQKLFKALKKIEEEEIEELLKEIECIEKLPREGTTPFLFKAKRIVGSDSPMIKEFCSKDEWEEFSRMLKCQIVARDEQALLEEYDSDPWLSIRQRYRNSQCPRDAKICYVRQSSFDIPFKC